VCCHIRGGFGGDKVFDSFLFFLSLGLYNIHVEPLKI
jgi:hypothetical protein